MNARSISHRLVWDPLVRIFHWSLACFFSLAWLLEDDWIQLHSHAGYTVALLVLFRLVWGVIGFDHARFSSFLTTPGRALSYLVRLVRGDAERHLGHDPAGSAMIFLLLISLLVTALSGVSLFAMEGSGPLADTRVASWPGPLFADIHHLFADVTLVLVVMHVAGVVLASLRRRENLIAAMITGRRVESSDAASASGETEKAGSEVKSGNTQ